MMILHYFLGFPPHRSGGLTKYALDLIEAEKLLGHDVTALYPGNFSLLSWRSQFVKEADGVYQLTNALPVPLMYGTKNPKDFMARRDIVGFDKFISEVKPDVFHVHTLMGLPKELLVLMKEAGVRIVYTSHDYFGLCPKVNFINNKGEVCTSTSLSVNSVDKARMCEECCMHSHGTLFLKVRNSKYVVPLKKVLR